jgi:DNA-binding response OmpR family regulator
MKKMALFIKRGLEEERYIVETAFDGQTGLEMALHNQYDAVVLDVMLPKRNGLAVLSAMRAAGKMQRLCLCSLLEETLKTELRD